MKSVSDEKEKMLTKNANRHLLGTDQRTSSKSLLHIYRKNDILKKRATFGGTKGEKMKNKVLKRWISLLLSVLMLTSGVFDAFAAEEMIADGGEDCFAAVAEEFSNAESPEAIESTEEIEDAKPEKATPSELPKLSFYNDSVTVMLKPGAFWLGEGEGAIDRSLITKVVFVQGDAPDEGDPVLYADEDGLYAPVYLSEEGTVLTLYYLNGLSFNADYAGMFNGFTALTWLEIPDSVDVPYSAEITAADMFEGVTGLETLILGTGYIGAVPGSEDGNWVTDANEAYMAEDLYDALPLNETKTFHTLEQGHEFSVTYEMNGGNNSSKNKSVYKYGIGLSLANPSKTYNTFAGWYRNAELEGDPVTGIGAGEMGNVTLYASWTPYTYTVSFLANGGSGTMKDKTMTVGTATALTSNSFKRTGYHFYKWNTKADGTGTAYSNKQKVTLTTTKGKNIKLYAQWKENKYNIVFDKNGGTGTMSGMENRVYSREYTLSANKFTRKGYLFGGWSTSKTGSKKYSDKAKVSKLSSADGGTVTLYAVWNPISYTIKYNKNGGTGDTMSTTKAKYGTAVTLRANTYKKTGYTFKGWSTSSTSTTVKYENKDSVKNLKYNDGDTVTLYAVWSKKKYTLTYEYNGGKSPESKNRTTYTVTDEFTLKSPTKTGYTFAGWYSDSKLTKKVTKVKKGTTGDKTFYAKWTQNSYTVKYSANGGSGSMSSKKLSYSTTYTIPANKFTRTGYTFKYYTDSKGNKYYPGDKVKKLSSKDGATVTLTAYWKANTYTIKFNANGGSGTMSSKTATYGKTVTLPANKFTNAPGLKFSGWNTKANGTGTTYKNKAEVKNLKTSGTITLYAQWKVAAKASISSIAKRKCYSNWTNISVSGGYYDGFECWRSKKSSSGFVKVGEKSLAGEYCDDDLEAGTIYYYKVRAYVYDEYYNKVFGDYSEVKSIKTAQEPNFSTGMTWKGTNTYDMGIRITNKGSLPLTVGGSYDEQYAFFLPNYSLSKTEYFIDDPDCIDYVALGYINSSNYKVSVSSGSQKTIDYLFSYSIYTGSSFAVEYYINYDGCSYFCHWDHGRALYRVGENTVDASGDEHMAEGEMTFVDEKDPSKAY